MQLGNIKKYLEWKYVSYKTKKLQNDIGYKREHKRTVEYYLEINEYYFDQGKNPILCNYKCIHFN